MIFSQLFSECFPVWGGTFWTQLHGSKYWATALKLMELFPTKKCRWKICLFFTGEATEFYQSSEDKELFQAVFYAMNTNFMFSCTSRLFNSKTLCYMYYRNKERNTKAHLPCSYTQVSQHCWSYPDCNTLPFKQFCWHAPRVHTNRVSKCWPFV